MSQQLNIEQKAKNMLGLKQAVLICCLATEIAGEIVKEEKKRHFQERELF